MRATLISRRQLLKGFAALSAGTAGFGGYAIAEPFRLGVTRYKVSPAGWPNGLTLRLAVLADLHACEPWMPVERIRQIVARTNALGPDATLLLGDYVVGQRLGWIGRSVPHEAWAEALAGLKAPLGVHAVLGNHDWWEESEAQRRRVATVKSRSALEAVGIPVYENESVRLKKGSLPFWIAGLGDQWAYYPRRRRSGRHSEKVIYTGRDDLPKTLHRIPARDPVILMAHEPDIFPEVPKRVSLTISGHTHGGQVRLAGYSPIVPSKYGQRYAYGHIVEDTRHLVVSGGLGCSGFPVRFGVPPEVVLIEVAAAPAGPVQVQNAAA
jgi:predicted MPP superfamily phosphohydrolase